MGRRRRRTGPRFAARSKKSTKLGETGTRRSASSFSSSKTASGFGSGLLQRHGNDIVVVWDPDDPASEIVVRAAYSLARSLAVREGRTDRQSLAAILETDRAARGIEKQVGYLDEVPPVAETVKGHGEKIADRSARMADELRRDVERLDAQIASMRTQAPTIG